MSQLQGNLFSNKIILKNNTLNLISCQTEDNFSKNLQLLVLLR